MKLVIGNQNYSSWSMRPWLLVAYHGLDIEIEKISLSDLDALRRRFAHGKVPVLVDGSLQIWDSIAILEYLVESFPHTRGWPDDPEARAVARSVSAEMHSGFGALRNELPMNCRRFFPGYRLSDDSLSDVRRIQQIWNMCRERYGRNGPWLFGRFTVADAMYAPVVMRFRSAEVELDSASREYFETMHECDAVKRWLAEGRVESETVDHDELDWPSTELP